MGEITKIQWTDHTFNCWRGCSKVSKGCANCYAAVLAKRNPHTLGDWGPQGTRVVASEAMWSEPLKWDRQAKADGIRRRVFCASMADVFELWEGLIHNAKGDPLYICNACGNWRSMDDMCCGPIAHYPLTMQTIRERLFRLIDATPSLDWLLLTKRPENIAQMMPECVKTSPSENWFFDPEEQKRRGLTHAGPHKSTMSVSGEGVVRDNVWIGTSVEDQETAVARIPHLLKVPAKIRFLSMEPLLGPVKLTFVGCPKCGQSKQPYLPNYVICRNCGYEIKYPEELRRINWTIIGGESGAGARPFHIDWCSDLVKQCRAAQVPVFVKQLGASPKMTFDTEWKLIDWPRCTNYSTGKDRISLLLHDSKGGNPDEWADDLRVREFPS